MALKGLENIGADATLVKYSVIGGLAIAIGIGAYFLYNYLDKNVLPSVTDLGKDVGNGLKGLENDIGAIEKDIGDVGKGLKTDVKNLVKEIPTIKAIKYDATTSNPVTEYIQANAIRDTLNNPNSKLYDPNYKNAKINFVSHVKSIAQQEKENPNYIGPIVDISKKQAVGDFINMPKMSGNSLGTNFNAFEFKNGWQGKGFYKHINKLVLQVYILNNNEYNQIQKKDYSSIFNKSKKVYEPFGGLFRSVDQNLNNIWQKKWL